MHEPVYVNYDELKVGAIFKVGEQLYIKSVQDMAMRLNGEFAGLQVMRSQLCLSQIEEANINNERKICGQQY